MRVLLSTVTLKRIKEIADIDFLDSEMNLFYYLSARILMMMIE